MLKVEQRSLGVAGELLQVLRSSGIEDICVAGGAVRDRLYGRAPRDIDLAVRLPIAAPVNLMPPLPRVFTILPRIRRQLDRVAAVLGERPETFFRDEGIPFRGMNIDMLGLIAAVDLQGRSYPDIFVTHQQRLFCAHDELSVNCLILTPDGDIGPDEYVEHLSRRVADFQPGPHGLKLFGLVRALRFCNELGLKFTQAAFQSATERLESIPAQGLTPNPGKADYVRTFFPRAPAYAGKGFVGWLWAEVLKFAPPGSRSCFRGCSLSGK